MFIDSEKLHQIKLFVFGFMFYNHLEVMKQVTMPSNLLELEDYSYHTYNKVMKYLKGQTTLDGKFSDAQLICAENAEKLFGKFRVEPVITTVDPDLVKQLTLVNGKIPRNSVCPFRKQCGQAIAGDCAHNGLTHDVPFSCGAARAFALINR